MKLQELLLPVQEYCEQKIISGDYKIISYDDSFVTILLDEQELKLWFGKYPINNFGVWSTVLLSKYTFQTEEKRKLGWKTLEPKVEQHRKTTLKKEKEEQIKRLEKELEELRNS